MVNLLQSRASSFILIYMSINQKLLYQLRTQALTDPAAGPSL